MKKIDVVKHILKNRYSQAPKNSSGAAFAPTNIALVKYWGKRNQELNLPVTSSLSISLADKGATTTLMLNHKNHDEIYLNGNPVDPTSSFAKRLTDFLNLFREPNISCVAKENMGTAIKSRYDEVRELSSASSTHFSSPSAKTEAYTHTSSSHAQAWDPVSSATALRIDVKSNIPIAAGLASSACGFAALTKALDQLYGWNLSSKELSILARLGSGSASRSLWNGFVEWHRGTNDDGSDSHGESLETTWPEFRVGLLIMNAKEKNISSRVAMQRTVETSALYSAWPNKVSNDLHLMKQAIVNKDFALLGKTAESNALNMHATMLSAWPPVNFSLPETLAAMQTVWRLRNDGLPVYFTQDAGPNLKLLFLQNTQETLLQSFATLEVVQPF